MVTTKTCPRCCKTKPLAAFSTDRGTRLGVSTYCKVCLGLYRAVWKAANPEKVKESQRKWRMKNRARHRGQPVEGDQP